MATTAKIALGYTAIIQLLWQQIRLQILQLLYVLNHLFTTTILNPSANNC